MLGYRIPEGYSGGETLGLHGYLLVNFGYPGMFALFFILGLIYKWLHLRLKPANPNDAVELADILVVCACVFCLFSRRSADLCT